MEARREPTSRQGSESSGRFNDITGSTPKEKISIAHARLAELGKTTPAPAADDSMTPSSAGDIESAVPISIPQTTLSLSSRAPEHLVEPAAPVAERVDVADVVISPALIFPEQAGVQTIQPSAIFETTEHSLPGSLQLGPSEFAVTMPMDSVGKDNYDRVLAEHSDAVKILLAGLSPADGNTISVTEQAQSLSEIRQLIEKLDNITVHTDLNIAEHVKRAQSDVQKEALWAEYTSAKFLFLGQLIEIAGAQDLHLLFLLGKKDKADLVERYFLGKGFAPIRSRAEMHGHVELSMINGSLSVGILSAEHDGIVETYRPPAVIFAMDSSFNASSPVVEHLRTTYARNGNLLPVVHLIIANSSEHIQRCLPDLPEVQRLRLLLYIVENLVDMLGDLQDNALSVQDDAEEIFTCLLSDDFNTSWKLPAIEPLHIVVGDGLQSQDPLGTQVTDPMVMMGLSGNKRIFDTLDTDTPESKSKRIQLSQEHTQITTQSTAPASNAVDLKSEIQILESQLVLMKADHAAEVEKLQRTISDYDFRLIERIKGWEGLQGRFEKQNRRLRKMRGERDALLADKTKAEQKAEKQQDEITKLKDERTQLKKDLQAAREERKAEGGLGAEIEVLREQNRKLSEDCAKLEKSVQSESTQLEYARRGFQNASSAAGSLQNEVASLKAMNAELQRRLDAEVARLSELKKQRDESTHVECIEKLERQVEGLEKVLRKKEEDLRNIRSNRPATRATSTQPRSPKLWGSNGSRPTSPGVNNGISNRSSSLRFSSEIPRS